jgi:hypothetical protein
LAPKSHLLAELLQDPNEGLQNKSPTIRAMENNNELGRELKGKYKSA